jgi:hypothetical protein
MAIDIRRIALATAEAVLKDLGGQDQQDDSSGRSQQAAPKPKKTGLSAGKAMLLGAGVITAGRAAMRARGGGLLDSLQERLSGLDEEDGDGATGKVEDREGEEDLEDEDSAQPEDYEEEEPEEYEEEEPEGYEDEEPEDYEDEEPEDYEDEEPEDYEEEEPEDYEEDWEDEDEEEPEGEYEDEPEDYEEEEEEEREPSRVSAGGKGRRRGSSRGHSRDGTA